VATSWLQEMRGGSELKKSTLPTKASPMIKQKSKISKALEQKKGFLKNSVKADFFSTETLGFTACFFRFLLFDFMYRWFFYLKFAHRIENCGKRNDSNLGLLSIKICFTFKDNRIFFIDL